MSEPDTELPTIRKISPGWIITSAAVSGGDSKLFMKIHGDISSGEAQLGLAQTSLSDNKNFWPATTTIMSTSVHSRGQRSSIN